MARPREDKFVSLMDIALMAMKKLRADGKLEDMEESDEINACSIVVPVEIDYEDGSKPPVEEECDRFCIITVFETDIFEFR